jgi:hypothetical protein
MNAVQGSGAGVGDLVLWVKSDVVVLYNTIQLKKLGKELILPRPFSPEAESLSRGSFNQTASQSDKLMLLLLFLPRNDD